MIEPRPLITNNTHAAGHHNAGRTVLYRTGNWRESTKPAIILAQDGSKCDLAVFTYDHGVITQLGANMIDAPTSDSNFKTDENVCWLVES